MLRSIRPHPCPEQSYPHEGRHLLNGCVYSSAELCKSDRMEAAMNSAWGERGRLFEREDRVSRSFQEKEAFEVEATACAKEWRHEILRKESFGWGWTEDSWGSHRDKEQFGNQIFVIAFVSFLPVLQEDRGGISIFIASHLTPAWDCVLCSNPCSKDHSAQ